MQHHHYDDHHDRKHHKKHKNGHSRYHRHKFVLTFEENEYIEKEIAEKVTAEWKAIYREGQLGFFLVTGFVESITRGGQNIGALGCVIACPGCF